MVKYSRYLCLKCNFKTIRILDFQEGGKVRKYVRKFLNDQIMELVDEISFLGVTLGSTRSWNKHRTRLMVK